MQRREGGSRRTNSEQKSKLRRYVNKTTVKLNQLFTLATPSRVAHQTSIRPLVHCYILIFMIMTDPTSATYGRKPPKPSNLAVRVMPERHQMSADRIF
jgi:hypothetical protein